MLKLEEPGLDVVVGDAPNMTGYPEQSMRISKHFNIKVKVLFEVRSATTTARLAALVCQHREEGYAIYVGSKNEWHLLKSCPRWLEIQTLWLSGVLPAWARDVPSK